MALTKTDKATDPTPPAPLDDTVTLELSLYTNYTWQGVTYESGKAYRFRKEDAMQLLGEQDMGRQVWKLYRAPKPKLPPQTQIIDSTAVEARPLGDPMHGVDAVRKRIDVGTDDEIADVLNRDGDITV